MDKVSRRDDPTIEPLPWDTAHFGFPVARLTVSNLDDVALTRALEATRHAKCRLVYWTTGADREVSESLLAAFSGLLADRRAVFELTSLAAVVSRSSENPSPYCRIVQHPQGPASPRLVALGIAAGADSRFRTDERIPHERFERLYEIWMKQSTLGELADVVLVALPAASEPIGVITLTVRESCGQIGLIAVADEARGRGVGTRLMESAHRWMATQGATLARVVTQYHNQAACRLYARMGYRLEKLANVYHFWPIDTAGRSGTP